MQINSNSIDSEPSVEAGIETHATTGDDNSAENSNAQSSTTDSRRVNVLAIALILVALVVGGLWAAYEYYSAQYRAAPPPIVDSGKPEGLTPHPMADQFGNPVGRPANSMNLSASFSDWQPVFQPVYVSNYTGELQVSLDYDPQDFMGWQYDFHKIGQVQSEPYSGGDLILAAVTSIGPCKGGGCNKPIYQRYVVQDGVATLLEKNSDIVSKYISEDTAINPFQLFELELKKDSQLSIPALQYPSQLVGDMPEQKLTLVEYLAEEVGPVDTVALESVFIHPELGQVYTTKATMGTQISFSPETPNFSDAGTINGCSGPQCFGTNGFFVFRPDGTFLKYQYTPDLDVTTIDWSDGMPSDLTYVAATLAGCNRTQLNYSSVVDPTTVATDDLQPIGQSEVGQVWGLVNRDHPLHTEFYQTYVSYMEDDQFGLIEGEPLSYEEFIAYRPVFFWRDPFGRLLRYNNEQFLPPFACEPIIYLYPEEAGEVTVRLGGAVNIFSASPRYESGWKVWAEPSGQLTDRSSGWQYPYLFWEGWSHLLPMQKEGFVVAQPEVASFLTKTVQQLGLNQQETADFLQAWLPKFSQAPYYFITFYEQDTIDALAPIVVDPQPDTIIRVLMDYRPLAAPIQVQPLYLPTRPVRRGFTVVEWGGLNR